MSNHINALLICFISYDTIKEAHESVKKNA